MKKNLKKTMIRNNITLEEISSRIEILQVETKAETLIDIGSKTGIEEVFAVGLVTASTIAQVGDR